MLLALAIAGAIAAVAATAGPARAGEISVYGCRHPSGGQAPVDGWSSWTGFQGVQTSNACAAGQGMQISIVQRAQGHQAHAHAFWRFRAPADTKLRSLTVHRAVSMGPWGSWTAFSGTDPVYDAAHTREGCASAAGCSGLAAASPTYDMGDSDGAIIVSEACTYDFGCGADAGPTFSQIWGTVARLIDNDAPSYGSRGGTLMAGGAKTGNATLTAQLADKGVGLFKMRATVDGQSFTEEVLSTYGGRCVPAAGETSFLYVQPCPLSNAMAATLNTAQLRDGTHNVKVFVSDAARNETLVFDDEIVTANKPAMTGAPTIRTSDGAAPTVGGELVLDRGTWERNPTAFDVTWQRCAASRCHPLTTPDGSWRYTLVPEDAYSTITATVAAKNVGGVTTAAAVSSDRVADRDGIVDPSPRMLSAPRWVGDVAGPHPGDSLVLDAGRWRGPGHSLTIRFSRCAPNGACAEIAAGSGRTYNVASADIGSRIVATVEALSPYGVASESTAASGVITTRTDDADGRDGGGDQRRRSGDDGGGREVPQPPEPSWPIEGLRNPVGAAGHVGNGQGASENARVAIAFEVGKGKKRTSATTVTSRRDQRQVIRGQLLNSSGRPISDAKLVTAWQQAGSGRWIAKTGVTTLADGRFAYILPKGPSREVRFVYFAFSDSTSYGESNTIRQRVLTPVSITATPRRARNGGTVRFTGSVARDGIPSTGVLVTLEARYPGSKWKQFKVVRSTKSGRYSATYRFTSTSRKTTYSFRARVARQGSYPFDGGTSRSTTVTVTP